MLKVISDKEGKEFAICFDYMGENIDEISNENTCGMGGISDELELTKVFEQFGAKTIYFNMFECKIVDKSTYDIHLINYDGDKNFIVPISRFSSLEDALRCKEYLLKKIS